MNKYELKRNIFNIFENARILFNDYYNGKDDYTQEDKDNIKILLFNIIDMIDDVKEVIDYE